MPHHASDRTEPRRDAKPRRATREPDATPDAIDAAATDVATTTGADAPVTLTHLGFVNDATTSGVKYVSEHALTSKVIGAYAGARDATALKGSLTKIEALIARFGAPVAQKVVDTYPSALANADAKVDAAVKTLSGVYNAHVAESMPVKTARGAYAYAMRAKASYPENVETLKAARAEYLAKIERTVGELRTRAVDLPSNVTMALTTAIAQARAALDSHALFDRVKMLYEQLLANPRVAAVATRVAPVATRVMQQPIVAKAIDVATPYANAIATRVMPSAVAAAS